MPTKKASTSTKKKSSKQLRYRGVINIDFTGKQDVNELDRLRNALIQAKWKWVGTSAFTIEDSNINLVWQGIDLVARQADCIGILGALTMNIQGAISFSKTKSTATAKNHTKALQKVLKRPFPKP